MLLVLTLHFASIHFLILIFPWITYHYVLPMEALLPTMASPWQLGALLPSHTVSLIAAKNWPVGA